MEEENKSLEVIKTDYFEENRVDVVYINGKEYFIVDQIARALGYKDPKILYRNILQRWKDEFDESDVLKIEKIDSSSKTELLSIFELSI